MQKVIMVREINSNNEVVKELGKKKFDNFIEMTLWLKDRNFNKFGDCKRIPTFSKPKSNGNTILVQVIQ